MNDEDSTGEAVHPSDSGLSSDLQAVIRDFDTWQQGLTEFKTKGGWDRSSAVHWFLAIRRKSCAMVDEHLRILTEVLADVDRWESLAGHDPAAYRAQVNFALKLYKRLLDWACHVPYHRSALQAGRDETVGEIEAEKPHFSYTQIANEYTRRTGLRLTRQQAERISKRGEGSDDVFNLASELAVLRLLQKCHETLKPFVAKSRAT
jgi:hypothetical protein